MVIEAPVSSRDSATQHRWRAIAYWTPTLLFAVAISVSGILGLVGHKSFTEIFKVLEYPQYLLVILGVAKLLGAAALLQEKLPRLKEWAYAGLTIDVLGAACSYLAVGEWARIAIPAVYFVILAASYLQWRQRTALVRRG